MSVKFGRDDCLAQSSLSPCIRKNSMFNSWASQLLVVELSSTDCWELCSTCARSSKLASEDSGGGDYNHHESSDVIKWIAYATELAGEA